MSLADRARVLYTGLAMEPEPQTGGERELILLAPSVHPTHQALFGGCSGQGAGALGSECQHFNLPSLAHYSYPGVRNTYMHKNLWPSVNQSVNCYLGPAMVNGSNTSPIFGKHPCFSLWGALPHSQSGWTEPSTLPKWL